MNAPKTADHEHEPCCQGPDSPCYICQPDAHNCSPTCRLHVTHVGPCLQAEEESKRRHVVLAIAMGVPLVAFVVALVLALQN